MKFYDNNIKSIINGELFAQYVEEQKCIPARQKPYFLRWVALFCEQTRLAQKLPLEFDKAVFFSRIESELQDWQLAQARDAIALYCYFLREKSQDFVSAEQGDGIHLSQTGVEEQHERILEEISRILRLKHRALSTERAYIGRVRDFLCYFSTIEPYSFTVEHIEQYLSYLAAKRRVAKANQRLALNALFFFFCNILKWEFNGGGIIFRPGYCNLRFVRQEARQG